MSGIFDWLFLVIRQVTLALGYPGIFLLMFLENIIPPIPSEIVMPFSGFVVAAGALNFLGVLIAGTLGAGAGSILLYFLGYKMGEDRLRRWLCRYGKYFLLSEQDLDKTLNTFERYGKLAIFIGRLIPGVRSLISIPAGLRGMDLPVFLTLTLAGTLAWNTILAGAGYLLGRNWQQVLAFLDSYERVILIVAAGLLLFFVARRLRNPPEPGRC